MQRLEAALDDGKFPRQAVKTEAYATNGTPSTNLALMLHHSRASFSYVNILSLRIIIVVLALGNVVGLLVALMLVGV